MDYDRWLGNGDTLDDQIKEVVKYSKFMSYTLDDKAITEREGGCYIKGSDGAKLLNMQKVDDNLHTHSSCKMNAAKKQSTDRELNMNNVTNQNNVYYSLVQPNLAKTTNGYYDCYLSDPRSSEIEKSSNEVKEVTIWKAFNENEKHLIKKGNYAYYRNGALFICDKQGNVLKQMGNTIDSPQDYYLLSDSQKRCYGDRYTDIR
jgi:hypothetical protein